MQKDHSHLAFVLDCSGSMNSIKNFIIENFNKLINDQKKVPGKATVSVAQFSGVIPTVSLTEAGLRNASWSNIAPYTLLQDFVDINDVKLLSTETFMPAGGTPLRDAVGRMIVELGQKLSNLPESLRPEKVVLIIMTDGEELNSKIYSQKQIDEMVKHQQDVYKWQIIYIGANQVAEDVGSQYGMLRSKSLTMGTNQESINATYSALSSKIGTFRSMAYNTFEEQAVASACMDFSDQEKKEFNK